MASLECPSLVKHAGDDQMLDISSEHRLRSENLAFDIDVWYPRMKEFTPKTVFLPLTRDEAVSLMNCYQQFCGRDHLTDANVQILRSLEKKLDHHIAEEFSSHGAFLRLCGRSPKDADPADPSAFWRTYESQVRKLTNEGEQELSADLKMEAISQVSWLKVTTGMEAMNLLVTSERVFTDLHDWLKWGEPEQIVLREWVPEMRMDYEFRAYICGGKMRALSQYDHYGCYPHLQLKKDLIQEKIVSYWQVVHPAVGLESYCMDFAFFPKSETVLVIELSPFLPCTGAALFNWQIDEDQMLRGDQVEFRVKTSPYPQLADLLEMNWDVRWAGTKPHAYENLMAAMATASMPSLTSRLTTALSNLLGRPTSSVAETEETMLLFVYGTLKRDFHWSHKYLFDSECLGTARTAEKLALVMGECGVPYLLGDVDDSKRKARAHFIRGELWRVNATTMKNLDEYEGVGKAYYSRRAVRVVNRAGKDASAEIYYLTKSSSALQEKEFLPEYSRALHDAHYNAMRHILIKQELYLQGQASTTTD